MIAFCPLDVNLTEVCSHLPTRAHWPALSYHEEPYQLTLQGPLADFACTMLPGYLTKQEQIAVRGVADVSICSLLDRNQFFDPVDEALNLGISSATWPLFGLLWPSGAQLAARIALHPVDASEHILEIGCGLALASIVAHRRGADITASDCHPLAAGFLQRNLRLNHLLPMPYVHGQWGGAPVLTGCAAVAASAQHYELIIGSDVLYERDSKGDLAHFIALHAAPAAEVWIVDPDRSNRAAFNKRMAAQGFLMREERLDTVATAELAAYKGRLLTYRRDC
jgi:predicted nicotinamide N-methyase